MARLPVRASPVGALLLTGLIAAGLLWFGPAGADTAAHVYQRWLYEQHGFVSWDNYWYGGRYVFVTYSWLYYPVAAVVGIKLLAVLSLAVASAAFASYVSYLPAVVAFALVWGAYAVSGAYPFMLGFAFALLALASRRLWLFAPLAVLAWAASPLAVLLLAVGVVGLRRWRETGVVLALIAGQIVLAHVYHGRGHFPFRWQEALAALVFAVGGAVLARGRRVGGIFLAYVGLVLLSLVFQSQLGENAARLRFLALPLALLAVRGHRWWIGAPLVVLCAFYNLTPLAWSFEKGLDERAEAASYWAPAVAFLRAHADPNYRVNALDTVGHWEAVWLPEAGFPITRGWYRQDDFPENAILYDRDALDARTYLDWLHARAVRYVLVPRDRLDYSSAGEPPLAAKLPVVARAGAVTIHEVPNATPIVPGATVVRLSHDALWVRFPRAGTWRVNVRGHDEFDAPHAGVFKIGFA
jgi:hypothetical protein